MCLCRFRNRGMPTCAHVPANSKDREHNCGLFLDVQTEMEHTPPLPLWCGGAARLWGFFLLSERKRAALGQEAQADFPGGKPCSPVIDLQRRGKKTTTQ